ncbi:hypothetical protein ACSMFQ_06480 [Ectopseudomonas chengduensis]|jgi:hypothetical protein|nr:hypothetical protein [Pseudomonas chengduensis]KJU77902.1 hypothetical protein N619_17390 [Pseudomonas oleovorans]MDH1561758.1 hypothetical protein [Pseudomonas chengduensis]
MSRIENSLLLYQRIRNPDSLSLHCREVDLRLSDDRCHLVLSRYVELYVSECTQWEMVRHHQVRLTDLLRWMILNSQRVPPRANPDG